MAEFPNGNLVPNASRSELLTIAVLHIETGWFNIGTDAMTVQEFPLAWRWTDPKYAVLSAAALSSIQPLEVRDAKSAFEQAQVFRQGRSLSASLFVNVVHYSADVPDEEGCAWLRAQHEKLGDRVTVVWSAEQAVGTTWETFTRHWSDFCYPMEDVMVWPMSGNWVLLFQHYEEFEFGQCSLV